MRRPLVLGSHQGPQPARSVRTAQVPQRFGLDLPDAFTTEVELLTDVLERMFPVATNAEPHADDFFFFRREGLQDVGCFLLNVRLDDSIHGRANPVVFEQVSQGGFTIAAHRCFKRNRFTRDGFELLHLLGGDLHPTADLFVRRRAAQFLLTFP